MANLDDAIETVSVSTEEAIEADAEATGAAAGDAPAEAAKGAVPEESEPAERPKQTSYEPTEEVPELLGRVQSAESETPEIAPVIAPVQEAAIPADNTKTRDDYNKELQAILASLQDTLTNTQYTSAKIDAVSGDTDCLIQQVNSLSNKYDLLAAEINDINAAGSSENMLSKSFLTVATALLALLVIFQIYTFISMTQTQRRQNVAGAAVLGNISSLSNKLALYNKNTTMARLNPFEQPHAQPSPVAPVTMSHAAPEVKVENTSKSMPVLEKLNILRNGLAEKKLIRKETGDWFVYSKKSEECISDVEVVEVLNQAYKKIGRALSPGFAMPPFKALCILKPDGKGGTEVVMTKEFLPL